MLLDRRKAEPLFAMVRNDVSLTEVKKKARRAAKEPSRRPGSRGPSPPRAEVRVKVLNGSGQFGRRPGRRWMQNTEGMLLTSNGGNAPAELKKTTLEYAPNQADQARRLADSMGLPASALKEGTKDADPKAEMTPDARRGLQGRRHPDLRSGEGAEGHSEGRGRRQERLRQVTSPANDPLPGPNADRRQEARCGGPLRGKRGGGAQQRSRTVSTVRTTARREGRARVGRRGAPRGGGAAKATAERGVPDPALDRPDAGRAGTRRPAPDTSTTNT